MKNNTEINAYLKKFRAASVDDKEQIEAFLAGKNLKAKVKLRNSTIPTITFHQFETWYNKELPHTNEIVYSQKCGTLGIVKEVGVNFVKLGVAYRENELLTEPVDIPFGEFRKATDEEALKLQHILSEKKLRWSQFYTGLARSYTFAANDQIRITRLGVILGYGVYKDIDEKGDLITFCVKMNGEPVRYSLHEVVGPEKDFQLEPMTGAERDYLSKLLSEVNRSWNGHQSRVEPLNLRGEIGETYYYISDYLDIVCTKESGRPKDVKRHRRLNYFIVRDDAEEILALIEEKRKRQLINNEDIDAKSLHKKKRAK